MLNLNATLTLSSKKAVVTIDVGRKNATANARFEYVGRESDTDSFPVGTPSQRNEVATRVLQELGVGFDSHDVANLSAAVEVLFLNASR